MSATNRNFKSDYKWRARIGERNLNNQFGCLNKQKLYAFVCVYVYMYDCLWHTVAENNLKNRI